MHEDLSDAEENLRKFARARVQARRTFYTVLAVWIALAIFFVGIWALSGRNGSFWPVWPVLVLGVIVVLLGIRAYVPGAGPITEASVDAEVDRLRRRP